MIKTADFTELVQQTATITNPGDGADSDFQSCYIVLLKSVYISKTTTKLQDTLRNRKVQLIPREKSNQSKISPEAQILNLPHFQYGYMITGQVISNEIENLNNTIKQLNLTHLKNSPPKKAENTFLPRPQGTFSTTDHTSRP